MTGSFNVLSQIEDESITAKWLRENSLLGSGTIWRCLAGAYHNFCILDQSVDIDGIGKKCYATAKVTHEKGDFPNK